MKKVVVLGGSGFVGRHLHKHIKETVACEVPDSRHFNFLDKTSFDRSDFDNTIVADCANVNNGSEEDMLACNYTGFSEFISFLRQKYANVHYVYISTISVMSDELVEKNAYVRTKKLAENVLQNSGLSYQIMRLSYPIGPGENKLRMISRIVADLRANKPIRVSDVFVNLNDVRDVVKDIWLKVPGKAEYFISSNRYYKLAEVTAYLRDFLGSKSQIEIQESSLKFEPFSETPFAGGRNIFETLKEML